jgi:DNA-binding NtrC family response regulator
MERILCVDDDLNLLWLYQDELSEEVYGVTGQKGRRDSVPRAF